MTNTSYTPGPWEIDGSIIKAFGRGTIAVVPSPRDSGVFECFYNIRLIAAAPDMAEALESALNSLETKPIYRYVKQNAYTLESVRRGRAILAKIKGE